MDSGGRQINQMNNWVDPYKQAQQSYEIQEGIKNKNVLSSSRPYSAYQHQTPDFMQGQQRKPSTTTNSTLGRLLLSSNAKSQSIASSS